MSVAEVQRRRRATDGVLMEGFAMQNHISRREFGLGVVAAGPAFAAMPAVYRIARAQAYPSRPVRLVVGFPPAGVADITARVIGQWLSERLGQQFVIENRAGAGSNIATQAGAEAAPHGHHLPHNTPTEP